MAGSTARFSISASSDSRSRQRRPLFTGESLNSFIRLYNHLFVYVRTHRKQIIWKRRETLHFSFITSFKKSLIFFATLCMYSTCMGVNIQILVHEDNLGLQYRGQEPKFSCQFQSSFTGTELALLPPPRSRSVSISVDADRLECECVRASVIKLWLHGNRHHCPTTQEVTRGNIDIYLRKCSY